MCQILTLSVVAFVCACVRVPICLQYDKAAALLLQDHRALGIRLEKEGPDNQTLSYFFAPCLVLALFNWRCSSLKRHFFNVINDILHLLAYKTPYVVKIQ